MRRGVAWVDRGKLRAKGVHAIVNAFDLNDNVSQDQGTRVGAVENGIEPHARVKRAGVKNAHAAGGQIAHPDVEDFAAMSIGAERGDLHAAPDTHAWSGAVFVKMTPAIRFERADDLLIAFSGKGEGSGGAGHDRGIGRKRPWLGWESGKCFVTGPRQTIEIKFDMIGIAALLDP
jgi:hypothetical protein